MKSVRLRLWQGVGIAAEKSTRAGIDTEMKCMWSVATFDLGAITLAAHVLSTSAAMPSPSTELNLLCLCVCLRADECQVLCRAAV